MAGKKTYKGTIIAMEKDANGKKKPNNKCRVWKLVVSLGKDKRTGKYPQKARIAALVAMYSEPAGPEESDKLVKLQSGEYDLVPDVPIISDEYGGRMLPQKVGNWWSCHRRKLGLPDFTLHELRHSFLTVAARNGVHPSVMQHLAGHTNSKITMEIYTHMNMDQKRTAMSIMQDAFKTQRKTA